jgi:methionine aminopeptidase
MRSCLEDSLFRIANVGPLKEAILKVADRRIADGPVNYRQHLVDGKETKEPGSVAHRYPGHTVLTRHPEPCVSDFAAHRSKGSLKFLLTDGHVSSVENLLDHDHAWPFRA